MRRLLIVAILLVTGCEPPPPSARTPETEAPTAVAVPTVQPDLPPAPRYVGRWAASEALCPTGWWRFWNDEVRTGEGEMRCDILPPDAESGDEALRTVCQAEGRVTREAWVIRYSGDDTMTVTRDAGPPVLLRKC